MRTIKTSNGAEVALDGDLLSIMEVLYHEVTAQRALDRSFEDMVREINHLIAQMKDDELRSYLAESLFLNTVKYENDKLEAYMRRLEKSGGSKGSAAP
jgi:phage gp29-like protein